MTDASNSASVLATSECVEADDGADRLLRLIQLDRMLARRHVGARP